MVLMSVGQSAGVQKRLERGWMEEVKQNIDQDFLETLECELQVNPC